MIAERMTTWILIVEFYYGGRIRDPSFVRLYLTSYNSEPLSEKLAVDQDIAKTRKGGLFRVLLRGQRN